jgi:hypothetical protein
LRGRHVRLPPARPGQPNPAQNKVYANAHPGRALRQRIVEQVEEILWKYKLAPATLRLPASPGIDEIQVFSIAQRVPELREDVLRTLDRAIPSLLFFELTFQGRIRFAAAYKRMSEAAHDKQFVAAYYVSPWQDTSALREALPVAIDIGSLYEQMLRRHMLASGLGLRPRPNETLEQTAERGSQIRTQMLACQRLEATLKREAQFNRKVEINATLRQARAALEELQQ